MNHELINISDEHLLPLAIKAMVWETPGKPLIIKEIPLPEPSAMKVLVKIIACGDLPD